MSSHHIVREDQEPALILADLADLDEGLLDQLLEWSPTVVVSSEWAPALIAKQIKVDIVIGTRDPRHLQDTIRFIPSEQPFVDAAVEFLADRGYQAAYLVSSHTPPKALLAYLPRVMVTLFTQGVRYYPVRSGFSKWKPAGEILFFSDAEAVRHTGLTPIGENQFRTTRDGLFRLDFSLPYLIIGERYSPHSFQHDSHHD